MDYLIFDVSEGDEGVTTLEACASTRADAHAAVLAEVQSVLDWAWLQFPDEHGPLDDGMAWDHALLVQHEAGDWLTATLTLTGAPRFVDAFFAAFGDLRG